MTGGSVSETEPPAQCRRGADNPRGDCLPSGPDSRKRATHAGCGNPRLLAGHEQPGTGSMVMGRLSVAWWWPLPNRQRTYGGRDPLLHYPTTRQRSPRRRKLKQHLYLNHQVFVGLRYPTMTRQTRQCVVVSDTVSGGCRVVVGWLTRQPRKTQPMWRQPVTASTGRLSGCRVQVRDQASLADNHVLGDAAVT